MKALQRFLIIVLMATSQALIAQTAKQIIQRIDKNQLSRTQKFAAKMIIEKGRRKLVKKFFGYGQRAGEKSFMQFTNPEDRGVKYLKVGDELWMYFPDADDIMKISGHMLKRGLMGSDISYEDMMEDEHFEKRYDVKRLDDATTQGQSCYVIDMVAKVADALYAKQRLYIHKSKYIPLKIEMYARGGRLLKTMTQHNVRSIGGRQVAHRIVIRDARKKTSKTTITFTKVSFNVRLPSGVFTRRYLKR